MSSERSQLPASCAAALALPLVFVAAACTASDSGDHRDPAPRAPGPPAAPPAAPSSPASTPVSSRTDEDACALPRGIERMTFEVAGTTRAAHLSAGLRASAPAPVVFVWHGFGASPLRMLRNFAPEQLWPEALVVAPVGLPRTFPDWFGDVSRPGWQITPGELDDRDVSFFDTMLADLVARRCVDRSRVYSTGFSNGGFFSNLLGCVRGSVLAANAPVAGGGPFSGRCPSPVPTRISHGTVDATVGFEFARESTRVWAATNGCSPLPKGEPNRQAHGCNTLAGCQTPLVFCSTRLGHRWPAGEASRIVTFLRAHRRARP